jgi:hypothetical protein
MRRLGRPIVRVNHENDKELGRETIDYDGIVRDRGERGDSTTRNAAAGADVA